MENITIQGFTVTQKDFIFLQAASTVSNTIVRLEIMAVRHDGRQFQTTLLARPDSAGNLALTTERGAEYLMTSITAHLNAGSPGLGQCFVRAGVMRGGENIVFSTATLISGYLPVGGALFWPGGNYKHPGEGIGTVIELDIANPAAGANFSFAVPSFHTIRPLGLTFILTTDANAANRVISIAMTNGAADTVLTKTASSLQTASLVHNYSLSIATQPPSLPTSLIQEISMPEIKLNEGWTIDTTTDSIQAGDQYSAIKLAFEEWLMPS